MKRFRHFLEPPNSARPIPLWFLNHRLKRGELARQIGEFTAKGCGGFILHARHGLLTSCLTGGWSKAISFCIEEGHRHGLRVWLHVDGNHPYGTAAGRVTDSTPDHRQITLGLAGMLEVSPGESVEWNNENNLDIASVLGLKDDGDVENLSNLYSDNRVKGIVPHGIVRILIFDGRVTEGDFNRYALDTLNSDAVSELVIITDACYHEVLRDETAKLVEGLYISEPRFGVPDAGRIPWTPELPDRFKEEYGYGISKALPSLVLPGEGEAIAHRCRFHRCVADLFCENYYEAIAQTCREIGWTLIGHCGIEGEPAKQPWTVGDFFKTSKSFNTTGCVTSYDNCWNNGLALKLTSSVAVLSGKPAMAEAFGHTKGWRSTLADWARQSGFQLACGINVFVPHAAYYSIEGFRKWDAPPAHSYQQPFWPWYRSFTDTLARYTALLSEGTRSVSAFLLFPAQTFQGLFSLDRSDIEHRQTLENRLMEIGEQLIRHHYDFDFIPEEFLSSLTLNDEKHWVLTTDDKRQIITPLLVLPACRVLKAETLDRLKQWAKDGARISIVDSIPDTTSESGTDESIRETIEHWIEEYETVQQAGKHWLEALSFLTEPGVTFEQDASEIIHRHQTTDDSDIFFLHNTSATQGYQIKVTLPTHRPCVYEADPDTGRFRTLPVAGPNPSVSLSFEPGQSYAIVVTEEPIPEAEEPIPLPETLRQTIPFKPDFIFFTKQGNNLPLTAWQTHTEAFNDPSTHQQGTRRVHTTTFWVNEIIEPMSLLCDGLHHQEIFGGHGKKTFTVELNGETAGPHEEANSYDRLLVQYDITERVRLGENRLTIHSSAQYHDPAHITEALYIQGDFSLRKMGEKEIIFPPETSVRLGSWAERGYPYYSGTGIYRQDVPIPDSLAGHRTWLRFEQVFDLVEIWIDEQKAGMLWKPPWTLDVSEFLKPGQNNRFEFRVVNSLENQLLRRAAPSGLCGDIVLEVY